MKTLKKLFCCLAVLCLLLSCMGCVRMDMGVDIKDDGTASLTSKVSIEASSFEMLTSLGEMEGGEASFEANGTSVDISKFVKETIGEEEYYSFEETKEFSSHEELIEVLKSNAADEDVSIFESVDIKANDRGGYDFKIVTSNQSEETSGDAAAELPISMPDDWLVVTMTVKMPGEVKDTNGEIVDDQTVKFIMNDFTESNTYTIHTESQSKAALVAFIISAVVFVGACGYLFYTKKNKR